MKKWHYYGLNPTKGKLVMALNIFFCYFYADNNDDKEGSYKLIYHEINKHPG